MNTYHKINTIYKREPDGKRNLIEGEFSCEEFKYLYDNQWVFTEKVDGTNMRVIWDGEDIIIKGKTDRAQLHEPLLEYIKCNFDTKKLAEMFPEPDMPVCFYGEGYGGKIQKGGKYSEIQKFILFDIKINGWWLKQDDVVAIAKDLNIEKVPVVGSGSLGDMVATCKEGFSSWWGNFEAEGIVARPQTELRKRNGERVIVKLKCRDFK